MRYPHMIEAERHWKAGRLGMVGYLLCENLPPESRPAWAGAVLQLCCSVAGDIPREIQTLQEIAWEPARWKEARPLFREIRLLTLQAFRIEPTAESTRSRLLHLAESVAKVVYNASGEPSPFSYDAAWWIPQRAQELVEKVGQPRLFEQLWRVLCWVPG
jgi:hypothetical protein